MTKRLTDAEARKAYELDVKKRPRYPDGAPRKAWEKLCEISRYSWSVETPEPHRRK